MPGDPSGKFLRTRKYPHASRGCLHTTDNFPGNLRCLSGHGRCLIEGIAGSTSADAFTKGTEMVRRLVRSTFFTGLALAAGIGAVVAAGPQAACPLAIDTARVTIAGTSNIHAH